MTTNASAPPENGLPSAGPGRVALWQWVSLGFTILLLIWFYGFESRFNLNQADSAIKWLYLTWNPRSDYEHGKLIPFLIIGLIASNHRKIRESIGSGSWCGLAVVALGCLLYVAACRTLQPRLAIGGLPFILMGMVHYLWGWRMAKLLAFPLFFLWMAIPLPTFQQATTHLQLLATQMAHYGSGLFGVETYTQGTTILPIHGYWKPLSIAHGCSGIRSLMALIMITSAWAYLAKMVMWKRVLLFASALPLAIVGNALRVISIFVIAEYGSAEWAVGTWHDWSGLLLFYPFTLLLLLGLHSLLDGGLPWKANRRRQLKRSVVVAEPIPETDPHS